MAIGIKDKNNIDNSKIKSIAKNNKFFVWTKLMNWGMKKFAYPINYMSEGYYVLMAFTAEENVPAEISRQMRITDGVIRHMITVR